MSVQGGGVVRLFHRERECYVSAEGSFAESSAVVEDGNSIDKVASLNVYNGTF